MIFCKYTAHLLRCYAKINPQRIKDTPAVNFRSRLVSVPSLCKSVGYTEPPWRAVVLPRIEFAVRTRSQRMYRTYILWRACGCCLFSALYPAPLFSKGLRIVFSTVLAIQNRHGGRWFHAVARFGLCTNLVVEQCTRTYTVQQSICQSVG